jgi:drug/metabolite transporter (DMT)-like permease
VALAVSGWRCSWRGLICGHACALNRYGLVALRAACAAMYGLVLAFSFSRLPLADASALSYTMVPMVMLLSPLILRETVKPWRWYSMALGLVGALMTLRPSLGGEPLIYVLVLLVNLLNALVFVLNRVLRSEAQPAVMLAGSMAQVALYGSASMTLAGAVSWLWIGPLLLGPFGAYLGLLAARHDYAVTLAPITYLRLPVLALIAWEVFAEPPNWLASVGLVLICAAELFPLVRRAEPRVA